MTAASARVTVLAIGAALALLACGTSPGTPPTPRPVPTEAPEPTAMPEPTQRLPTIPTPVPLPAEIGQPPLSPTAHAPVRLAIPRIGLDSLVVEIGTKFENGRLVWDTVAGDVGYYQGTGTPGHEGNVVLSGHISSLFHGNVFKRLPEVVQGDGLVVLTRNQQSFLYRVASTRVVLPSVVEVMDPTPDETVTLITCVPDGIYSHRLIVQAKRA